MLELLLARREVTLPVVSDTGVTAPRSQDVRQGKQGRVGLHVKPSLSTIYFQSCAWCIFGCSSPRIICQGSSELKEPVKVYKWDGTAVKNALDDAVKVSKRDCLIAKVAPLSVDMRGSSNW